MNISSNIQPSNCSRLGLRVVQMSWKAQKLDDRGPASHSPLALTNRDAHNVDHFDSWHLATLILREFFSLQISPTNLISMVHWGLKRWFVGQRAVKIFTKTLLRPLGHKRSSWGHFMEEDDGRKVCHWGVSICAHMSWLLCNRRCLTRITKTYSSGYCYCYWYVKSQIYKIPQNIFCCLYFQNYQKHIVLEFSA